MIINTIKNLPPACHFDKQAVCFTKIYQYPKKLKKIFDDKYASSARIYTPNAAGNDLFTLSVWLLLRYRMKFAAKISTRSGMHHNPKNRISNIFS